MHKHNLFLKLKNLVGSERKITAEIIGCICEIDRRSLYLQWGHTSLFALLTAEIGYTPSAAQRRIDAARLLRKIPEINTGLQSGDLNLTQVSMLAQAVRQKRREQPSFDAGVPQIRHLLDQVKSKDLATTQKMFARDLDLQIKTLEKKTQQKDDSVRIEVTFSKDELGKLERVKELSSHQLGNPKFADMVMFLADQYLKSKDPLLRSKGRSVRENRPVHERQPKVQGKEMEQVPAQAQDPALERADSRSHVMQNSTAVPVVNSQFSRGSKNYSFGNGRGRHVAAADRWEIFRRDQCCQWRDPRSGKVCNSKFRMQIDHKRSIWLGGSNDINNLQVLCSVHNRYKFKREAGLVL